MNVPKEFEYLIPEIENLSIKGRNSFEVVFGAIQSMLKGKRLEEVWINLNSIQGSYLYLRDEAKDRSMVNLDKTLGRAYNMIMNTPQDFERFRGRVYHKGI